VIYGENKRKVVSMVLFRPTKAVVFQIFKRWIPVLKMNLPHLHWNSLIL
jgi:hypothetical protein